MPNLFSINVVTQSGANLIAQATAANPIVFVDALSGTTAAVDDADLRSKTASFYNGISGTIQSCSAHNNVARVVSRFSNTGANSQAVKSVCIRGRLASQSDSDAVIVAAMSDSQSEIVFPSNQSPLAAIRFPFNIIVSSDGVVQTSYADGAMISDLDRFVSMYKAGNTFEGESQNIKGVKTFDDPTIFNTITTDYITCNSDCYLSSLNVTGDAEFSQRLLPATNNTGSVGISGKRFEYGYFKIINADSISVESISFLYGGNQFDVAIENGAFSFNGSIFPHGGGVYDLGDQTFRWRSAYVENIYLSNSSDIYIYEDDGDVIIVPEDGHTVYIGEAGNYQSLHAAKLHGLLETLFSPNLDVGTLAEIAISNASDSVEISLLRGSAVKDGDQAAGKTLSVTLDGVSVSTNKWKILNKCTFTDVASKVMAVRVE